MPRRSQESGTHALYSLLEEEARLRKKVERRAGTAEAEVVKLRALLEKRVEEAGQARPPRHVSASASSVHPPLAAGTRHRRASESTLSDVLALVLLYLCPVDVAKVACVSRLFCTATLHVSWPELEFRIPKALVEYVDDIDNIGAHPSPLSVKFARFVKFMCRGERCSAVRTVSLDVPKDFSLHNASNVASAVELVRACRLVQTLTISHPNCTAWQLVRSLFEDPLLSARLGEHLESLTLLNPAYQPITTGPPKVLCSLTILKGLKYLQLPFSIDYLDSTFRNLKELLLGLPSLETLSVKMIFVSYSSEDFVLRSSTLKHLIARGGIKASSGTSRTHHVIECAALRSIYVGGSIVCVAEYNYEIGCIRRMLPLGWQIAIEDTNRRQGRVEYGLRFEVAPGPTNSIRDE